jgi:7,8-dihydro-6-hydroxymethylpterin-pyrophosphokinase
MHEREFVMRPLKEIVDMSLRGVRQADDEAILKNEIASLRSQ